MYVVQSNCFSASQICRESAPRRGGCTRCPLPVKKSHDVGVRSKSKQERERERESEILAPQDGGRR